MEALVLVLIVIILVLLFKRTFSSVIYAIVMVDMGLRLIDFFCTNLNIGCNLPASFSSVIVNNVGGIIQTILLWLIFAVYVIFLGYTVRIFIKKK